MDLRNHCVYYLPEEHYIGVTNNVKERMNRHIRQGHIIDDYEILCWFERRVDAEWLEIMFHQRGYHGHARADLDGCENASHRKERDPLTKFNHKNGNKFAGSPVIDTETGVVYETKKDAIEALSIGKWSAYYGKYKNRFKRHV